MTRSPWARFLTFVTPQTRASPSATSANTAPTDSPFNTSCRLRSGAATRSPMLSRLAARHVARVLDRLGRVLGRSDHHVLFLLDLPQHQGLAGVPAGVVELHVAVERVDVGLRERVAQALRIEVLRAPESVGPDLDRRRGLRYLVGHLLVLGVRLDEGVVVVHRAAEELVLVFQRLRPLRRAEDA